VCVESPKGICSTLASLYVPHKKSIQSSLWREINGMKLYLETEEGRKREEVSGPAIMMNKQEDCEGVKVFVMYRRQCGVFVPNLLT
jgi:hypothetical protein